MERSDAAIETGHWQPAEQHEWECADHQTVQRPPCRSDLDINGRNQTFYWVHRYNADGLAYLGDRHGGGA